LTGRIKNGGELLDIKVNDHLIITHDSYFSFADQGLL
jgi:DNA repair protein RadC